MLSRACIETYNLSVVVEEVANTRVQAKEGKPVLELIININIY